MDDSEFVVIDEDGSNSIKEAIQRLKKAEKAYNSAHDALVKSNILLQDSLNLALHQALQSVEPDFDTNIEQLTQRINDSLYTSTDSVLRDHVKSLCSRLVGVSTENTTLSDKLRQLTSQIEKTPKLDRLSTLIDETGALLALNEPADPCGNDVEKLCARVEVIRDKVRATIASQAQTRKAQPQGEQIPEVDVEPGQKPKPKEEPSPSTSPEAKEMNITKMIREEVSTVLTREIASILSQQKDLIQEALKPIAAQQIQQRQMTPIIQDQAAAVASTSPINMPVPSQNKPNREPPAYINANVVRTRYTHGPVASQAPSAVPVPAVASNVPPELVPRHLPFMEYPTTIPGAVKPGRDQHRQQPKPTAPSYWPEEESPTCPKCNMQCESRICLEAHLEKCLEY